MNDSDAISRTTFLTWAGLFQCGMLIVALSLATWADVDLWQYLTWRPRALAVGCVAAIPLCVLSLWIQRSSWGQFRDIRNIWRETLLPLLASCHRHDVVILSLMVGVSEELLFRGTLQLWFSSDHFWAAVIAVNLLFGLAHAVTRLYVVLATAVGMYFTALMWLCDPPSLLAPIIAHTLCDLFAFELLRREASAAES